MTTFKKLLLAAALVAPAAHGRRRRRRAGRRHRRRRPDSVRSLNAKALDAAHAADRDDLQGAARPGRRRAASADRTRAPAAGRPRSRPRSAQPGATEAALRPAGSQAIQATRERRRSQELAAPDAAGAARAGHMRSSRSQAKLGDAVTRPRSRARTSACCCVPDAALFAQPTADITAGDHGRARPAGADASAPPPPANWQPGQQRCQQQRRRAGSGGRAPAATRRRSAAEAAADERRRRRRRRRIGPARYRAGHGGAAASLPDAAGRSGRGADPRPVDRGDQGGDDQRRLLPGAFPRPADHAGRADRRGAGAGRGRSSRSRASASPARASSSISWRSTRRSSASRSSPACCSGSRSSSSRSARSVCKFAGRATDRRQAGRRGELHRDDRRSAEGLTRALARIACNRARPCTGAPSFQAGRKPAASRRIST